MNSSQACKFCRLGTFFILETRKEYNICLIKNKAFEKKAAEYDELKYKYDRTVEISKKKSSEIEDFISKISEIEKENTYMISRDKQYIEEKILSQLKFPEQETRDSIYDGAILRQYKIWSNFIYDLKRKTFTCKNVEVDSIGRVKSMSFEQK